MKSLSITSHHATHPSAYCLQISTIQRRLGVSPTVARACVGLVFGDAQRADVASLAAITADRVAASAGIR